MSSLPPEVVFHRYLTRLPAYRREVYRGRSDLSKFPKQELVPVFEAIKDEINALWREHAARIQSPDGEVRLHLDYIDSNDVNAITFYDEGIHFVGITEEMLLHFTRACEALWRLNSIGDLLLIKTDDEARDFLFQAILLIQLQYIAYHELGHLFHGHVDSTALSEEFSPAAAGDLPMSQKLWDQAHEVEADGYAVHLLLNNLVSLTNGGPIHGRLRSKLNMEDCILTLFLVSVGSLFFFLRPKAFNEKEARKADHPFSLARMNVVLYDLTGWCETKRPDLVEWASQDKFQRIMSCVAQAAPNPDQARSWALQGDFLRSGQGSQYLSDLYAERAKVRAEMSQRKWTLAALAEVS